MIDNQKINKIQLKLKALVLELEKEENVKISFGTCRYSASEYGTRMTVKSNEKDNKAVVKADESICKMLGLPGNAIGRTFNLPQGLMKIVEIKTRNRKYPVVAENVKTSKKYKFTVTSINAYLGVKPVLK